MLKIKVAQLNKKQQTTSNILIKIYFIIQNNKANFKNFGFQKCKLITIIKYFFSLFFKIQQKTLVFKQKNITTVNAQYSSIIIKKSLNLIIIYLIYESIF